MAAMSLDRYLPRTLKYVNIDTVYFKPEKNGDPSFKKNKDEEKFFRLISDQAYLIALDEKGTSLNTKQFLKQVEDIYLKASSATIFFLIGGPYGLGDKIKARADVTIKLSDLTFNSEVATAVLAEQIYRIFSLKNGHPYHNE